MATILLVDDSSLSRKTARRILEGSGHQVRNAAEGLAALEECTLARPDLVLLDVTMPEINGLEVLRLLMSLDPSARVVMATADVQSSTRELAIQGGAAGFVTEPLKGGEVLTAVAAVVHVVCSPPFAS